MLFTDQQIYLDAHLMFFKNLPPGCLVCESLTSPENSDIGKERILVFVYRPARVALQSFAQK